METRQYQSVNIVECISREAILCGVTHSQTNIPLTRTTLYYIEVLLCARPKNLLLPISTTAFSSYKNFRLVRCTNGVGSAR